jgi:hypothetical protein
MRIRASVLLYIPLVTVLVTGCTDQAPAPAPEPAKSTAVTSEPPTQDSSKVVRKKKDPKALTGPTEVVP